MKKIGIVDYGSGNIFSVMQAIKKNGVDCIVVNTKEQVNKCDAIILPGVGSFKNAMDSLQEKDLITELLDYAATGKPILGICLGMQLLFESSNEFGFYEGLRLIKGKVVKFTDLKEGSTIPQIQWNKVQTDGKKSVLFKGVNTNPFMYFVHSYYVKPSQPNINFFNTSYGGIDYCCAVEFNNIYGVQFHPERSSLDGLLLLKNFINLV